MSETHLGWKASSGDIHLWRQPGNTTHVIKCVIIDRRVSFAGIIMKSFYPGPDRDPRIRSTTQVASSSAPPHSEGNAIATVPRSKSTIKLEATAVGAAAASPATVDATPLQPSTSRTALGGNSQAQTARRRSVTSTTQLPVMDEHIPFDWEIDPKKLRLKYAIGKGNFG